MRNLFEDAIYLFDMEIEQPTIITSQADSNFELHVIPDYEYTCNDGFHIKPIGIALFVYFKEMLWMDLIIIANTFLII